MFFEVKDTPSDPTMTCLTTFYYYFCYYYFFGNLLIIYIFVTKTVTTLLQLSLFSSLFISGQTFCQPIHCLSYECHTLIC